MRTWAELVDRYLNDVPGCSLATATTAIRDAAMAFCERTRAWRETLDPQFTITNQSDYEFDLSADVELVRVLGAKLDGRSIDLLSEGTADGRQGVQVLNARTFRLYPVPSAGQRLVFDVALEPSETGSGVADVVFAKYARFLAHGAKAELFAMKQQPFSDPAAASDERMLFEEAISSTKEAIAHSHARTPVRVRGSFL
jgi:hypothetical protein